MHLVISQDILVRGLQRIQGIVEKKNTLPILSHFLLTAHESGEAIIHATDIELSYKGYLETTVQQAGIATLPARKTYDIIRELPAGVEVTLTIEQQGWAHITAGSVTFKVPCLPAEEYPTLPPMEEAEFSALESGVLEQMIRQTLFATSRDETRHALGGVLMTCNGTEMVMVATDGHRLAHTRRPIAFGQDLRVIVPRKALEEVSRLLPDGDDKNPVIEIASLQHHLVFRKGRSTLVTGLIEGQFPNFEGVVPKSFQRRATVDHQRFTRALRRVSLLSNEKTKPVRIDFAPDTLTLHSNTPEMGEASEEIPAEYEGEAMVMGFNARYLLEALAVTTDEHLALELNDPLSPGILRPLNGEQYFFVIMPMRV